MSSITVKKNNRSFFVQSDKHSPFWKKLEDDIWEPETFAVFDKYLTKDCCYMDIGAWIGPTILYGAQTARRTIAFEPDPVAFKCLQANISANADSNWSKNITVHNTAISSECGERKLGSRKKGGDSMSSLLLAEGKTSWTVQTTTLEKILQDNVKKSEKLFLKMDIEGGEYEILSSLCSLFKHYDVVLYLSLHPHLKFTNVKGIDLDKKSMSTRLNLAWYQLKLLKRFKGIKMLDIDGKEVSLFKEFTKILKTGKFLREVILLSNN